MKIKAGKKIAAVHDLSGIGHVSLMAVIPILTTMGMQVCPLPTAVLSNHTQFPEFTFVDLTDEMVRIIDQWERLGMRFDAFYTGYLGSPRQAAIVADFFDRFKRTDDWVVVDPVLGDNGHLYKGMSNEMVEAMRRLIAKADIITPNLTEVGLLLDIPMQNLSCEETLKNSLKTLSDKGPEIVVVTSVPVEEQSGLTSVYAYNREGEHFWKITCPYLPAHYPGTGDSFTSVVTGAMMQGDSLPVALDRAAQFILQGIRATYGYEGSNLEGIMLEKVLHNLDSPTAINDYQRIG